ncbi:MAG: hypothetical protein ACI8Y4_004234 [Candidatus Poriferisodalaceae bacterium]|jgi:hypothetical protein
MDVVEHLNAAGDSSWSTPARANEMARSMVVNSTELGAASRPYL